MKATELEMAEIRSVLADHTLNPTRTTIGFDAVVVSDREFMGVGLLTEFRPTLLTRRKMSVANTEFVRDVVYLLRERGTKAAIENRARDSVLDEGREAAFREVLALMQNQADVLGVPRLDICLDGFDALVDALDPPTPRPAAPSANAS